MVTLCAFTDEMRSARLKARLEETTDKVIKHITNFLPKRYKIWKAELYFKQTFENEMHFLWCHDFQVQYDVSQPALKHLHAPKPTPSTAEYPQRRRSGTAQPSCCRARLSLCQEGAEGLSLRVPSLQLHPRWAGQVLFGPQLTSTCFRQNTDHLCSIQVHHQTF